MSVAFAQQQTSGGLEEIVVTAQKRQESMQNVPLSIQAFGTERLEALRISDFTDYVKFLPSVSFTTLGPGFSLPYFRGVASGENNNHSGPSPSVGMYLDEQPITTIQGALDIHLYDIERVEALAGPQGTLYGASSQAGTIRIITNKPDPSAFDAGYAVEGSTVSDGGEGYLAEGFVNMPVSTNAAVRLVGWVRRDPGYIDNVGATRVFPTAEALNPDGGCVSNLRNPPAGCVSTPVGPKEDFNEADTYGARAALRVDLNDTWSITPTVMGQKTEADGLWAYEPNVGELEVAQFYRDYSEDEWYQAALTVEGKLGRFDVMYTGAYLKRDVIVDSDYSDYSYFYDQGGSGIYWGDDAGVPLQNPSQYVLGKDGYTRQSHELRIASPAEDRLRVVGGLFYQTQDHEIFQRYKIDNLGGYLCCDADGNAGEGDFYGIEVTGWDDTIWLTNQLREDQDQAIFGEVSYDFTDKLTGTVGLRYFEFENSIRGFFGFNANYSGNYGEALCFSDRQFKGSPCTNLDDEVDDSDTVQKYNLTYRLTDDKLVYATFSEGYRPGGINRNNTVPPYKPDFLTNYEFGWKTTWLDNTLRLNGAVFHQEWDDIQYSFLPPSGAGLTVIRNAGSATIDGIELDATWAATEHLSIYGGLTALNAELDEDYNEDAGDPDDTGPEAFKGDRLPITPEFKANMVARYESTFGTYGWFTQGGVVYNGDTYSDLKRADREILGKNDSYTLVDLSAGVTRNGLGLTLFISNAFDESAETLRYAQCATDTCGPNPYYVPVTPRTIGIRFSQEF
ncbi:MAG: TonB-dependent receptor [Lysobacterales bacterium]|nr:MAG: TonB-dependent receptor [Xanthomonadales bacterium]